MTIAGIAKEISDVVSKHCIYGIEVIISELVFETKGMKFVNEEMMHRLIHNAYERMEEE